MTDKDLVAFNKIMAEVKPLIASKEATVHFAPHEGASEAETYTVFVTKTKKLYGFQYGKGWYLITGGEKPLDVKAPSEEFKKAFEFFEKGVLKPAAGIPLVQTRAPAGQSPIFEHVTKERY